MALEWETDENGRRWPVYTAEQAQRIARAAWGVHFLLPHPDDSPEYAANLREFNRALQTIPPLDLIGEPACIPCSDTGRVWSGSLPCPNCNDSEAKARRARGAGRFEKKEK